MKNRWGSILDKHVADQEQLIGADKVQKVFDARTLEQLAKNNFALYRFRPATCFDHENDDDDIPEGVLASKKQRDVRKLVRKLDIGQAA